MLIKIFKHSFFIAVILISSSIYGQKEAHNWYFGYNAGITFHTDPPSALTDGMLSTLEGCSSLSDPNGNLLLYTDGTLVYNKNHTVMPNGSGLYGDGSSTQSGVIVPMPGSTTLFYVFTVPSWVSSFGFCYSIVDMTLDGGLGDVTATKNVQLVPSVMEKLSAVANADKTGYWVVVHGADDNKFHAYSLTSSGINPVPVVSSVGSVHVNSGWGCAGSLKFSSSGNLLALAKGGGTPSIELFDFDNSTGQVSNPISLPLDPSGNEPYGVEFSPDETKLYMTFYSFSNDSKLYQFDLEAGTPTDILNSAVLLAGSAGFPFRFGQLQLGPNQKIYVVCENETFLAAIDQPNALGISCNYIEQAVTLPTGTGAMGLPVFLQNFFSTSISATNLCLNDTTEFVLGNTNGIISAEWNFGDPASGINNTSSLFSPTHVFSSAGNYNVRLISQLAGGTSDTIFKDIQIAARPVPVISGNTSICLGSSTTLTATASGTNTFQWSGGITAIGNSITISPSSNTTYTVIANNGSCNSDPVSVVVNVSPLAVTATANPSAVCLNTPTTLTASGGDQYEWEKSGQPGIISTSSSFNQSPITTTTYNVTVTNSVGCSNSTSVTVTVYPGMNLNIQVPGTVVCNNEEVVFTATGNNLVSYMWADYTQPLVSQGSGSIFTKSITANYKVILTATDNNNCTAKDTQEVFMRIPPVLLVNIFPNDTICPGNSILLNVQGADNFEWRKTDDPGFLFTTSNPNYQPSPNLNFTTTYKLIGIDQYGCNSDTNLVTIFVRDIPPVLITSMQTNICQGGGTLLTASGAQTYTWKIADTAPILSSSSGFFASPLITTTYVLTGTNELNCTWTDTITITVLPPPSITISAGEDSICPGDQARLAGRGGISYGWYNKLNPGSFISADSILFAGPSVTSTYVVVGTDANGCTASAEQTLVVKPRPVGPGISGMPYMCPSSQNILYTANPFQPLSSYTWWVSTGLSKSYENKDTLRVNFGSPGTFTISLQERNEYKCYGDVINYSVEVQQVLTPPAPEGTDTVCSASASQTYNVPFSNPGSSYNWQVEGGTVQSGNGSPVVTINWTSMGVNAGKVWYIESTSGIPPCIWISDTLKVSIFPSPNTSAIMGDSSLCIGTSGLYSVNSNTSSIYSWNLNQGFGVISAGQGTRFIQVNWNSIGMDTLKVTETSPEGCPGPEKMLQVMVNPFPVIAPGDVQGPALVCYSSRNGSIYYLNNSNPSSRYYWSIQGGELIAGNGSDSIRVNWEENNLHNVNVYEKSKDSCVSQAVTVPVTLDGAAPEINAVSYPHNNNTEIEISWQLSYNLGQLNSYNLYKRKYKDINSPWSLIANNYYSNSYKDQNIRPQDEAYEYQYTITDACGDSSTSAPHHSMLLKAVADRASNKIYLSWNHYHNWKAGVERYEVWRKLDDEVNYSLYKEHGKDSSFSSQNGTEGFVHCYKIKAIEAGGNNYSWSNDTCVSFSNQLHIPSAYSPNGDGVNDNWVIRNIGAYKNAQVEIFNRWGELVFKSLQYHNEWDGNLNGKKLPDATYYYVIKLNQENEAEKQSLSGIVTIVK